MYNDKLINYEHFFFISELEKKTHYRYFQIIEFNQLYIRSYIGGIKLLKIQLIVLKYLVTKSFKFAAKVLRNFKYIRTQLF